MTLLSYYRSYRGLRERAEEQVKKVCCLSLCHCVVYDGCVMSLSGRSAGGEKQRKCVVGGSVSGEDDNVLTTEMNPPSMPKGPASKMYY